MHRDYDSAKKQFDGHVEDWRICAEPVDHRLEIKAHRYTLGDVILLALAGIGVLALLRWLIVATR